MKEVSFFFLLSFIFYFIGHLFWTIDTIIEGRANIEFWFVSLPFAFFSIFGLVASIKFYTRSK